MKKFSSCRMGLILVSIAALLASTTVRADSGAAKMVANPPAAAGGATRVAKGNNVNVRSRPDTKSEVVVQLKKGDTVEVREGKVVDGKEWLRIGLPAGAKTYVHSVLLKDGAASSDAINVRCGPGTNFKDIGKLDKGQKVDVVKVEGEWTRIKPTAQCSGWVSAEFFEAAAVALPPAPPVIVSDLPPAPPVAIAPPEKIIETRTVEKEVEVMVQYVVKDGIFSKVTEDGAPAVYELLTENVGQRQYRVAFLELKGDPEKFEGKHVRVLGNERWKKGERFPVIVVERIEMVW